MADDDLLNPMEFETEAETPEEEPQAAEPVASEPVKVEPVEAKPEPTVPLAALQEVRAENKTLKERLAELDQLKAIVAARVAPREPVQPPDIFQEPEKYQAFVAAQVQAQVSDVTAEMSERFARMQHGDDVVDAAFEAAKARGVVDQFRGRKDPWGDLTRWHKSQQALAEIGDDPAAYKARLERELREKISAELALQSVKPTSAAPSLAGQPNLSARNPTGWAGPTPLSEILGPQAGKF